MSDERANPYPRSGPIRGLLMRIRLEDGLRRNGRALIRSVGFLPKRSRKNCVWCCEPLTGRARSWHPECVKAYLVATGAVRFAGGYPYVIEPGRCADCGRDPIEEDGVGDDGVTRRDPNWLMGIYGFEVDHRIALSVAHELRRAGDRRWWWAWTVRNLRWLCHECHAKKTGADRRTLARLRRELSGVPIQTSIFDAANPRSDVDRGNAREPTVNRR